MVDLYEIGLHLLGYFLGEEAPSYSRINTVQILQVHSIFKVQETCTRDVQKVA